MIANDDDLFRVRGNELFLSPRAMALIFGVPEQQVRDLSMQAPQIHASPELMSTNVPMFWAQNGRRRIREAFAAIGTEDLIEAVRYLDRLENSPQK